MRVVRNGQPADALSDIRTDPGHARAGSVMRRWRAGGAARL